MKELSNLIIMCVFLIGCDKEPEPILEKPFTIIYKYENAATCNSDLTKYHYQSKNGIKGEMCTNSKAYKIGDVIK